LSYTPRGYNLTIMEHQPASWSVAAQATRRETLLRVARISHALNQRLAQ